LLRPAESTLFPYTTLFRSFRDDVAREMAGHDFLTIADLSSEPFQRLIAAAQVLKQARRAPRTRRLLEGRTLAMIFAKPSTRTRRSEEHTSELQSRENLVCR